jgi:hypothetical protein
MVIAKFCLNHKGKKTAKYICVIIEKDKKGIDNGVSIP